LKSDGFGTDVHRCYVVDSLTVQALESDGFGLTWLGGVPLWPAFRRFFRMFAIVEKLLKRCGKRVYMKHIDRE
jgi:hypothetical protein